MYGISKSLTVCLYHSDNFVVTHPDKDVLNQFEVIVLLTINIDFNSLIDKFIKLKYKMYGKHLQ